MILLIIVITGIIMLLLITTSIVNLDNFPFYKLAYDTIKNCRSIIIYDGLWGFENIIFFTNDRTFQIGNNHYIHRGFLTILSPYTLYWYIKMMRYIKYLKKNPRIFYIYTSQTYQTNIKN